MREKPLKDFGFGSERVPEIAYEPLGELAPPVPKAMNDQSILIPGSPLLQIEYSPPRKANRMEQVKSMPRDLLLSAIHESPVAIIILDGNRRVCLKNVCASRILDKNELLCVDARGGLHATSPVIERRFNQFLGDVLGSARGRRSAVPGKFFLSRPNTPPVSVSASVQAIEDRTTGYDLCWMILCLRDPAVLQLPSHEDLKAWFGLTKAEAKLACAITSGQTSQDYSLERGISLNTVKTQFQSILAKTRVHRQVDLVRLLSAL
ncbi:MAG TPA: helix-turn-helix transcriptional regulator [Burkholderiales bacterium]|nr:helix-turn-helix transcriptional regulator [Burkholderiales bacterium]